jgi:hypothetical protein
VRQRILAYNFNHPGEGNSKFLFFPRRGHVNYIQNYFGGNSRAGWAGTDQST